MRDDPVIQALREVRHRISVSVGHDPQRLVAYISRPSTAPSSSAASATASPASLRRGTFTHFHVPLLLRSTKPELSK